MNFISKQFKTVFGDVAKANGFERAYGGWFKESVECIAVLDLQKSNYGDYFELNIKIYVQGMFGNKYQKGKDLVKKDIGNIFTRQPKNFNDVFNFDNPQDDEIRKERLETLFNTFLTPFTNKALSRSGIKDMAEKEGLFLLPAVKEELGNLSNDNVSD